MHVAYVTAMDLEMRPLTRLLPADSATAVVGVGPVRARRATERLLASHRLDHVVVVGVAGGVDPALQIGDVVMPRLVVDRSSGREHAHDPIGGAPTNGTLLTCAEAIFDMTIIETLRAQGIVAVDMETAAVAEACEARGIGWSVFRGISDRPADGLVDERVAALARPDGSPDLGAVARYLARRPWAATTLARLGHDLKQATTAAARAAVQAVGRQA